jgi:hypothetical protein
MKIFNGEIGDFCCYMNQHISPLNSLGFFPISSHCQKGDGEKTPKNPLLIIAVDKPVLKM